MNKNGQNQDDLVYEDDIKKPAKKVAADIIIDEDTEAPETLVKKLKEKIKTLEKEKQEYMNGWQRERADLINYKKMVENEKVEIVKYANENLLEEITQVLDSFEMAFSNKEAWEKSMKKGRDTNGLIFFFFFLIFLGTYFQGRGNNNT